MSVFVHHERLKDFFNLDQIMEYCKEAHENITKNETTILPDSSNSFFLSNYLIVLLDKEHPVFFATGASIRGYSTHENKKTTVRIGGWIDLMTTIGHEVGHLSTSCFEDQVMEESKAYAFGYAWTKSISAAHPELMKDYEAELDCPVLFSENELIRLMARDRGEDYEPAISDRTLMHRISRNFVASRIREGIKAIELYHLIIENKIELPYMQITNAK